MTQNVTGWFTERFETEVFAQYAQNTSRLGDTVAGGGTFVGDKVHFPRIGVADAYDSPAFARLALANVGQDMIEVSARPKFIAFGLFDPDKHKYSIATAVEYGKQAAAAIARAEDDCIIKVLADAAANGVKEIGTAALLPITTIGDYDTVADLDDVAEAIAKLGENEAFEGEEVTIVTPFRNKMQFAMDPYMASNDVKANMPWNDLNWRRSERLTKDTVAGGVDLFVYAKSAIVSGYNDKLTKIDERDGPALTDIIGYWNQVGAAARSHLGIIRIKSKASFSLYRQSVRTFETNPEVFPA